MGETSAGSSFSASGAEKVLGHTRSRHRGDGVGLDVVLGPLLGQDPGEADQAHLGGAVVGLAEVAQNAGVRGGVEDPAVALLAHLDPRRAGHVERPPQVDVDDGVEQLRRHVVERLVAQDAGVVDDDVDPSEGVDGRLDDGLATLGRGHAAGVGDRDAAEVVDLLGGGLGRPLAAALAADRRAQVVDDDLGAARRQQERVLAAEAPAGAGDDCDSVLESEIRHRGRSYLAVAGFSPSSA